MQNLPEQQPPPPNQFIGPGLMVATWILILLLLGFALHLFITNPENVAVSYSIADKKSRFTIQRSPDLHFRMNGYINDIPVVFLLDTGATTIAIAPHTASRAKLESLVSINLKTANGDSSGFYTKIANLQLGDAKEVSFKNAPAIISPGLPEDEVLLGMSILRYFSITQKENVMILEINP